MLTEEDWSERERERDRPEACGFRFFRVFWMVNCSGLCLVLMLSTDPSTYPTRV